MKKLLLFTFTLLSLQHRAQVWCTPGSVWRFNHFSMASTGYKVLQYLGDTLVAGKVWNKLRENRAVQPSNFNFTRYYYTHVDNRVVYLLDQSTGNLDTLYNFNANIGDQWRLPPTSHPKCAASHVTVTDTGHVIIQGQSLRSFTLSQVQAQPILGSPGLFGAVYERLGAVDCYPYYKDNMCAWGTDAFIGGPMHCFSDLQISDYQYNFTGSCYLDVSVSELKPDGGGVTLYPNPSGGAFRLELPLAANGAETRLSVTDISGRELKQLLLSPDKTAHIVDLSQMDDGLYIINVYGNNKILYSGKILKQ